MDSHRNYVQDLKAKLDREVELNSFISNEFLQTLLSGHKIRNAIQACHWKSNPETGQVAHKLDLVATKTKLGRESLVIQRVRERSSQIRDQARKLFAILILLDKCHLISTLLDEGVNDRIFEGPDGKSYYRPEQVWPAVPELQDIRSEISDEQWKFPPLLPDKRHVSFPGHKFIPPFLEPTPKKHIGGGSFGDVFRARIPAGHLELYPKAGDFVYKRVRKRDHISWSWVKREVETLRERVHENVIPLIASFDSSTAESGVDTAHLYMVFPEAAGGDMEQWIHSPSTPLTPPSLQVGQNHVRDYLYGVISSIASGLAFIHREIDGLNTAHHDMKPRNIVLESNTWKICDFGKSHLKSAADDTGTTSEIGTPEYRPPEYYNDSGQPAGGAHGRSFDVFSLGCIAFQLAILAVSGWSGAVAQFKQRCRAPSEKQRYYPLKDEHVTPSFHNNLKLVKERIEAMKEEDGSDRLDKFLRLTQEMLEVDPKERPFAWEIEANMYEMLNPNATESDLEKKFKGIIEPFKGIIEESGHRASKHYHNPLSRAEHRNELILSKCIRDMGWSDSPTRLTQVLSKRLNQHHISGDPVSTLPEYFSGCEFVGRQDILNRLVSAFTHSNRVGLFGGGGNGKSHIAFQYAKQLGRAEGSSTTTQRVDQKHTFWVNGANYSSFQKSYLEIAEKIKLSKTYTSPDFLLTIKGWLDDSANGDWILVLDGLDSMENYEHWKQYLPYARSGQIIVTTRDREVLLDFNNLRNAACINVSTLSYGDSREFLLGMTEPTEEDERFVEPLLKDLTSPLLMKLAAKWLKRRALVGEPFKDLHELLRTDRMGTLTGWNYAPEAPGASPKQTSILDVFLDHVQDPPLLSEEAIDLLSTLACLSKDSVEYELILRKYPPEKHRHVLEYLSILANHSYVEKSSQKTYIMHEIIQQCQIHWLRGRRPRKMLRLYDETLCMILNDYSNYDHQSQHETEKAKTPSFLRKLGYMPHFEEFLTYVKSNKMEVVRGFYFTSTAARSIVNFCRVYREQNRYDDAICLLKFVLDCGIQPGRYAARERLATLCELARTHKNRPSGGTTIMHLKKALELVNQGLAEAKDPGFQEQEWRLMLERSMVLSKLGKQQEAREQLEVLEKIKLTGNEERKAVIRTTEQKARIDFEEGKTLKKKNLVKRARREWKTVIKYILEWHPKDELEMMEARAELAKVDLEIPTSEALDEAEEIYLSKFRWSEDTYNRTPDLRHIYIAERDLAAIWMRRGDAAKARLCLQKHLDNYVEKYDRNDGEVRLFAYLLRDAMYLQEDHSAIERLNADFYLNKLKGGLGTWYHDPGADPDSSWESEPDCS